MPRRPLNRLDAVAAVLLATTCAKAESGAPAKPLAEGALGIVRLAPREKGAAADARLRLEVYFPRAWQEPQVKKNQPIRVNAELVLADAEGVLLSIPAPQFQARPRCANDGGPWNEPVASLLLPADTLRRPLNPVSHLDVVALATLGKGRRMPLQKPAGKHTLMRVDFDGDGAADAELVSMPNEIGCDQRFEQPELQVRAEGARVRASCCGP